MRWLVSDVLLKAYRWVVSPAIHALAGPGFGCRFHPSCSEYAQEAVRTHGFIKGGILSLRRIGRCRPGGPSGFDPVPPVTSAH